MGIYNAVNDNAFIHEIGHNLGAGHDNYQRSVEDLDNGPLVPPNPTAQLSARGWIMYPIRSRTVMAYGNSFCRFHGDDCDQLPLFSNPLYFVGSQRRRNPAPGDQPGVMGPADNANTINRMAQTVSNYRRNFHQSPYD